MKKIVRSVCGAMLCALAGLAFAAGGPADARAPQSVAIRRTDYGIPHVEASNWTALGIGVGYAQASDNLCTLAELFATLRATRSSYATLSGRPHADSIIGRPASLDSDFFFRLLMTPERLSAYERAQSAELRSLVAGFATGYNRYVGEIHAGRWPARHQACRGEAWVQSIDSDDVYRRMIEISLAGGAARFVGALAHAAPAAAAGSGSQVPAPDETDEPEAALTVGGAQDIGSNAIALAPRLTDNGHALLFGNPHWFWAGPDRFYQAQMTIPGALDVAGAMFLGVPVVVIGFNQHVAWTHTVSNARRFGLFRLDLVQGDATAYWFDGRREPMTRRTVSVDVLSSDGVKQTVSRTYYGSRFGWLVDLSAKSAKLKWDARHAFALDDINLTNLQTFDNYLDWARSRSLAAFVAVQRRYAAVPWANTLAIGNHDARVWFADVGPVPGVSDALLAQCGVAVDDPRWQVAAARVPVLDGSRSACLWRTAADSRNAGALGLSQLPQLLTRNYAANMNGSYWLTDPAHPLTGLPAIVGVAGDEQSLRTRLGHSIVSERRRGADGYSGRVFTMSILKQRVLDSTSMAAVLYKRQLIEGLCRRKTVAMTRDPADGKTLTEPREVDIGEACAVLARWGNDANAQARGADLWDAFWARARRIDPRVLYKIPFDRAAALATPAVLNTDSPEVAQALAITVAQARARGVLLDAPRGDNLYLRDAAAHRPLYGGCGALGYFTVACPWRDGVRAGPMDGNAHGNSYLQIVGFDENGVRASTMLSTSESDDPASPHYRDASRLYAGKHWVDVAFDAADIIRRAGDDSVVLGL